MAYRRKTTYRRKTRRAYKRRTKRVSKFMVRAIKAISQGPVETKRRADTVSLGQFLVLSGYVGGASAIVRSNIFSSIPRLKNTGTRTEGSFEGNSIMSRGLSFHIHAYFVTPGAQPDAQFRFTVYSENDYYEGLTGVSPTDSIFDPAFNSTPTWLIWNTQQVKIHYRRTFSLNQASTGSGMVNRKFWVPLRKKVVAEDEEGLIANTYMGEIKGQQYYYVLEVFAPNVSNLNLELIGHIDTAIYFKDP